MSGEKSAGKYLQEVSHYQLTDIVGEGGYSIVRKAVTPFCPGRTFACKIISKVHLVENDGFERFQTSLKVLQRLVHPRIVALHEILKDPMHYFIVLEFCPGGSLSSYLAEHKQIDVAEARRLFVQILEAVKFVHDQGVAHRDIKPGNILLNSENQAKLADFGVCAVLDPQGLCSHGVGTPGFRSPECLSGKPYDGRKSDMWSLGVTLFAMVVGRLPWDTRHDHQIIRQLKEKHVEIPLVYGPWFARFIRSMLILDAKKRISAAEALDHPWITGKEPPPAPPPATNDHNDDIFWSP
jgi:serine/threonine protein kinase